MKIYLAGGHEEHMFDAARWFARAGFKTTEPGVFGEHEGKRGPRCPETTEEEHRAQMAVDAAIRAYGANVTRNPLAGFSSRPSLHEYVMDSARSSVEFLASRADVCYAILAGHAAMFCPVMPTVWHFNGQMHRGYAAAAQHVIDHGGRVVCYAEQESDLFPGMKLPVIHFGKDPDEWCGWTGNEESVLYVANSLPTRREACHYDAFQRTRPLGKWWLAGQQNESLGERARKFSYDDLKAQMRRSRLFFNLGTVPAPYTLGVIEAAMTGMPVMTERYEHPHGCAKYAVPELLGDGCVVRRKATARDVEEFISDGWHAGRRRNRAARAARKAALKHFDLSLVASQWHWFLRDWEKLC